MRGAAGPRPAMAPPAAFIPPALLLFILGPAAPKEGENRRDPKPNFSFFSFPPPQKTFSYFLTTSHFFSPLPPNPPQTPNPDILLLFPFYGAATELSAPLPEGSQRVGLWGAALGGGRREGGQKATL